MANPALKCLGSVRNIGHTSSMCFAAILSHDILMTPSMDLFLACQSINSTKDSQQNMCWICGNIDKWCTTLDATLVLFTSCRYRRDSHLGKLIFYSCTSLYNVQSFGHA
ncbi:hypothetical protein O6H91_20G029800 [Diphasiastrum complanatum]|uniref:Uncharacterized protein n=1 Tax=Diphasiastrum complanatum TaxID=34168 RepID=A0ACC2ANT7_DIPCM|nr:hypothetical protein O6H91_20G029800 [Diphasiastrum complanatum]